MSSRLHSIWHIICLKSCKTDIRQKLGEKEIINDNQPLCLWLYGLQKYHFFDWRCYFCHNHNNMTRYENVNRWIETNRLLSFIISLSSGFNDTSCEWHFSNTFRFSWSDRLTCSGSFLIHWFYRNTLNTQVVTTCAWSCAGSSQTGTHLSI
jgi:hypothetical protein